MSELSEALFSELEKHVLPSGKPVMKALKEYVNILEQQLDIVNKKVSGLEERMRTIESQTKKDSQNSSKPPSSDGLGKKNRTSSLRESSGKPSGGQPGHEGKTIKFSETPDEVIPVYHGNCSHCGELLTGDSRVTGTERRQVIELPEIKPQVIEYVSDVKECSCCGKESRAKFSVPCGVSYGSRVKAVALYVMNQHLVPYERTAELLLELCGVSISEGTLLNFNQQGFEALQDEEAQIKEEITKSAVAHFDETGIRCSGKLHWCHSASTLDSTYYVPHQNRGHRAQTEIGILPSFKGIAVHDHFKSYFEFDCEHALCNAHHLRELKFLHEVEKEAWAGEMSILLKKALGIPADFEKIQAEYDEILKRGIEFHASQVLFGERKKGARGRKKQRPGKNMLDRLLKRKDETLRFLTNPEVPFTNNLAERDLRMLKVKQKISGCYRTYLGAQVFCRIKGFVSTAKKRSINVISALADIFSGTPVFNTT